MPVGLWSSGWAPCSALQSAQKLSMHSGAVTLRRDHSGCRRMIKAALPGGQQLLWIRRIGQVVAGAGQAGGTGLHLRVVAESGNGCSSQARKDQGVQAHRHHQAGRFEQGQGLLGTLHLHQAAATQQTIADQALIPQALEQATILVAMERQPEHDAIVLLRQCGDGLQIGTPGLTLQQRCGPPAEHDRPAPAPPATGWQSPDCITPVGSSPPEPRRQLR